MVSVKAVGRFAFAKALSCKTFFIEGQKLLYFILPAGEYIKETLVVDLYLHIQELHKSSFTTSIKLISESVSKRDRQLSDSGHIKSGEITELYHKPYSNRVTGKS